MMRSHPTKLRSLLRGFAAGAFVVWVAAQALCFAHCHFGMSPGGSEQASCHASAPSDACHEEGAPSSPAQPSSSGSVVCSTLKSALLIDATTPPLKPNFQVLYHLTPLTLPSDMTEMGFTTSFLRQADPRDWALTPEVCLGPAHRSHAPPFLS